MQRKVDKVDAYLLKTANEAMLDVFITTYQSLDLRTKEHIITVQIQNIIGARSAAFSDVHIVDDDPYVPADAFHGHRVPISIINGNGVDADGRRTSAAVKTVLQEAILQLQ